MEKFNVTESFGSMVFNDVVMRERLPKETYRSLKKTIIEGKPLEYSVAQEVANAMKEWAIQKGATHYCHWFVPMTGITAEKHDSFIAPTGDDRVIMEFSGKNLIKGEPDASCFPSGGLRATFEARGYTAWDPTSPAFIKDNSLYIPTAFCSYTGQALDEKTPLLRSMDVISKQTVRLLKLLGYNSVKRVFPMVGPEQEYFLIDKAFYEKRPDLVLTGRTLIGAMPPKGQEVENHYLGTLKQRVSDFMKELDIELWKLGVMAKTKHNETAPAQHELAPVFTIANIATDHNHLTMEMMKKIALKHGLVCLLHEKPFAGVNGSGKHNNWSLLTDTGKNLLEPGENPVHNKVFLLILCAVIQAVDEYSDLLRLSIAGPGNDHRLGGHEAPPAIVSIYLGDYFTNLLENIRAGKTEVVEESQILSTGVSALPCFVLDNSDRNRTSPLAFTGNKFELRMLGSSASVAGCNTIINTIVADAISRMCDKIEAGGDIDGIVNEIVKSIMEDHSRIIFNGNNYSEEWKKEAERRGLPNNYNTVDAIECILKEKNIKLLTKHKVYSEVELQSRYEILNENYVNTIRVEALTLKSMVKEQVLPACVKYLVTLTDSYNSAQKTGLDLDIAFLEDNIKALAGDVAELSRRLGKLEKSIEESAECGLKLRDRAVSYRDKVLVDMNSVREVCDRLEGVVAKEFWPFPSYYELLFKL